MLFDLEGVTLRRGERTVLNALSAGLREGSTCVVGPSGSGKSTLLRLLNRLADPEQGVVRYRGQDVRERDPLALRREVCLVPQLPALLDGTVGDNLRFAAELAGKRPDTAELLRLAGLDEGFAERGAERLSVGEQQRVMLARALAQEPRVLLLDEPTSALDEAARDAIESTLARLRERTGVSLIVVTHDPAQARRLGEWVVRVEDGRAVSQGAPAEALPA